jgi:hypothetical protein
MVGVCPYDMITEPGLTRRCWKIPEDEHEDILEDKGVTLRILEGSTFIRTYNNVFKGAESPVGYNFVIDLEHRNQPRIPRFLDLLLTQV